MRYFNDGDLTVGMSIAKTPYPLELLQGDWHIVWISADGKAKTIDYDDGSALAIMGLSLEPVEPTDKRKKSISGQVQLDLNFAQWGLQFEGYHNAQGPATQLRLKANTTEDSVTADDEAWLTFGTVLDDSGYPFLQLGIAASSRSSRLDHLQNLEFIAKKTDPTGIACLELSKNEKLRLGYAVNTHGTFEEDILAGKVPGGDTFESLRAQLEHHIEAQNGIMARMKKMRDEMDEQLKTVGASNNGALPEDVTNDSISALINGASARKRKRATQHEVPKSTKQARVDRDATRARTRDSPVSASESDASASKAAPSSDRLKKTYCPSCKIAMTAQYWTLHEKTNKHLNKLRLYEAQSAKIDHRRKTTSGKLKRPSLRKSLGTPLRS